MSAILILMPTYKLTPQIILAAIDGFEAQKLRIDAQIAQLREMLDGGSTTPAATPEAAAVPEPEVAKKGKKDEEPAAEEKGKKK